MRNLCIRIKNNILMATDKIKKNTSICFTKRTLSYFCSIILYMFSYFDISFAYLRLCLLYNNFFPYLFRPFVNLRPISHYSINYILLVDKTLHSIRTAIKMIPRKQQIIMKFHQVKMSLIYDTERITLFSIKYWYTLDIF